MNARISLIAFAAWAMAASQAFGADVMASNGTTISANSGEFEPTTTYLSPTRQSSAGEGVTRADYEFVVVKSKSGSVSYLVEVDIWYDGSQYRVYDRAYLSGGKVVKLSSILHRVTRCYAYSRYNNAKVCNFDEVVHLNLTPEQVLGALTVGSLRSQVGNTSGSGEFVVTIPAADIQAAMEVAQVSLENPPPAPVPTPEPSQAPVQAPVKSSHPGKKG
jgi:hypothetical protein